ncbi:DUF6941 family protein [Streptomyces apocyni]|uniref:DUF6941 family protein n=1 Tax=Streptomyces apocyni TaxID=2654677 RepID=UPI0012E9ABC8|nr:hypothetical protein [Streptomyces apocyni]
MARLQYFLLAEYARVDAGGLLTVVGAGFDRVAVDALPGQLSLGCAARVLLDEGESEAQLSVAVRPPQGRGLAIASTVRPPVDAKPHLGHVGVIFAATFGLPVVAEGLYTFEVTVNGEERQDASFTVELQSATGQADA